jgi:hypothetical protein
VALSLTIPEITEVQELQSVTAAADGKSFAVVIEVCDTAMRLVRAGANGEHLPLVVLTTNSQILALDSVYVTDVSLSGEYVNLTFVAQGVRFV